MFITEKGQPIIETTSYIWGIRLNRVLLYVHMVLLLCFLALNAPAMVVVNIFSVLCYMLEYRLIRTKPTIFLGVAVTEVLIHMVFAVFFVGWDMGFQYYAFALCPFVYFSDHTTRRDGIGTVHPFIYSVITALAFGLCRFFCYINKPIYTIDSKLAFTINTANGIMIVALLVIFSYVYTDRLLVIEKELVQNADFDELTGLANRHQLDKTLAAKHIGEPSGPKEYAVAIFDLDDFKKVNDRFGHLAGDQVLKNMAMTLKGFESDDLFVGRWGGEEFMAITLNEDAYNRMMDIAEHIRRQVESSVIFFEHWQLRITVSIGVSSTEVGLKFKELVEEADNCLYDAKGNGKNQVVGRWENKA